MPIEDVGALRAAWQLYPARSDSPGDRLHRIGEFAERSRLSMKALRLYDRLGVLRPAVVDERTGYRRYRQGQLTSARLVAMLRRLDMPLSEVGAVLSAPEGAGAGLIVAYWEAIERRVASQRELALHLERRLSGRTGCSAISGRWRRQVPEYRVLIEQRHVLAPALAGWLETAMVQLATAATAYGGMVGPPAVVYHGEVSQDSDGPVEICVPIPVDPEAPGAGSNRRTRRPTCGCARHRWSIRRSSRPSTSWPSG